MGLTGRWVRGCVNGMFCEEVCFSPANLVASAIVVGLSKAQRVETVGRVLIHACSCHPLICRWHVISRYLGGSAVIRG